jgi:hypothetical protein
MQHSTAVQQYLMSSTADSTHHKVHVHYHTMLCAIMLNLCCVINSDTSTQARLQPHEHARVLLLVGSAALSAAVSHSMNKSYMI